MKHFYPNFNFSPTFFTLLFCCFWGLTPSQSFAQCGNTIVQEFNPNAPSSIQLFTVPAGVDSLKIQAIGADGGDRNNFIGGAGAKAEGTGLLVNEGDIFSIIVGESGTTNNGTNAGAAGGGGGSYIFQGSTPILIASGGGGGAGLAGKGGSVPLTGSGSGAGGGTPFTGMGYGGGGGAGFFTAGQNAGVLPGGGKGGVNPSLSVGGIGGISAFFTPNGNGGNGGFGGGGGGGATDQFSTIIVGGGGGGGGYNGGLGGSIINMGGLKGEGGQGGESFIDNGLFSTQMATSGTDGGGGKNAGKVIITFIQKDVIRPTASCDPDFTVSLSAAGTATIDTAALENGSTDNCGITDKYFAVVGIDTIRNITFTCASIGDTIVSLIVKDAAGNTDTCMTTITVTDPTNACLKLDFVFDIDVKPSTPAIEACNCQEQCITATLLDNNNQPVAGRDLEVEVKEKPGGMVLQTFTMFGPTDSNGQAKFCFMNADNIPRDVDVTVRVKMP